MTDSHITWSSDFLGLGYRYYDLRMNVAPLFENRRQAVNLWHDVIRWWIEPTIRVRFVEDKRSYWFVMAAESKRPESNIAFFHSMPLSKNYERFKSGIDGEAYLRLGMYAKKDLADVKDDAVCECGHEAEDHGEEAHDDLEATEACFFSECKCTKFETVQITLLHKKKTISDIVFMNKENVRDDALAWNSMCAHKLD